ncbi:hypothetical protein PIB30_078590 [Stylosanthes scabra]|uniref:Uncharacterized protein n=1 Tax=Stylosanthes scabra TaxID=79078 RepID=A0ABU6QRB4_9FABA|nr:hypothetical protein [Stylosanthes scabra]
METQLSTIADLVTCLTTHLSHNNPGTSQPPIDISHEEEEAFEMVDEQEMKVEVQACEEVGDNEQEMEVEKACKGLGFDEQEPKGVKIILTQPLGTSLANLPSNTPFEWVPLSTINVLGPHQYALLETDGQPRVLCKLKDNEDLKVGWQQEPRFKREFQDLKSKGGARLSSMDSQQGVGVQGIWSLGHSKGSMTVKKKMGGHTRFGIPGYNLTINNFGAPTSASNLNHRPSPRHHPHCRLPLSRGHRASIQTPPFSLSVLVLTTAAVYSSSPSHHRATVALSTITVFCLLLCSYRAPPHHQQLLRTAHRRRLYATGAATTILLLRRFPSPCSAVLCYRRRASDFGSAILFSGVTPLHCAPCSSAERPLLSQKRSPLFCCVLLLAWSTISALHC